MSAASLVKAWQEQSFKTGGNINQSLRLKQRGGVGGVGGDLPPWPGPIENLFVWGPGWGSIELLNNSI